MVSCFRTINNDNNTKPEHPADSATSAAPREHVSANVFVGGRSRSPCQISRHCRFSPFELRRLSFDFHVPHFRDDCV